MLKHKSVSIVIVVIAGMCASQCGAAGDDQSAGGVTGTWYGILVTDYVGSPSLPLTHLRLILRIREETQGHYTGVLHSPDERLTDLPLSDITLKDDHFRFELKLGRAVYEGDYNPDKNEIEGNWNQHSKATQITFRRSPVIRRPQEPVKPFLYVEQEVAYETKVGEARLTGTLTLPRAGGPFPAVLLISGLGLQDRDETLFSHKPFLVIADYLTRRGIAVLRVDDRGKGGSTGDFENATTADFAEDALAGVGFLKSRQDIDAKRIGLIGHSEGATIATMVAARSKDVAFIVMLAGLGVPGDEALLLQQEPTLTAMGIGRSEIDRLRTLNEKVIAIARNEEDPEEAKKKILGVYEQELAKLPLPLRISNALTGAHKAKAEAEANKVTSPMWRWLIRFDPQPTLMKVECPVLALHGDKDLHAHPKNLLGIQQALKAGGNDACTIKELPGLNHLFQSCQTGLPSEYARIEETFGPNALELIGDWIVARNSSE